jgi:hypothetical protein
VAAHSSSISEEQMLRVEASNLPKPRGAPRPRRLLPNPPMPRRGEVTPRHELLPPADLANPPAPELALQTQPTRVLGPANERWSVKLELGDDEIAKLYGQGMTRGAVVWKKGMLEWRPLLITPELSGLLRRTRITLTESPPLARMPIPALPPVSSTLQADDLTLPRPPRLPSQLPPELVERPPVQSVAPTALDVEPSVKPRHRTAELLGVAAAAFALAWLAHAKLHPAATAAALPPAPPTIMAAAAPACEPTKTVTASTLAGSGIPTVSIADLPLVGARGVTALASHPVASRAAARTTPTSSNGRPSRSALVEALSQVARAASGCGERGGPVRVTVSFANSGVARSIQVSGADLPAETRSCIIGAASRARVPAFEGDPLTVAKTL